MCELVVGLATIRVGKMKILQAHLTATLGNPCFLQIAHKRDFALA
eukprot:CAMPEP_0206482346 /NCGR_PEP_ID=MMETSP0324_2-20121206/38831_1 /ASSEMBLY_ACC=CAM_ASM_000836 /TAXON_ID=2866 /ORGANISM="Crypthecodinium cohnii, Strain Seligo" /LENGTH=44 /DNA_ID= /DNA_START= /DNA_END= /DNA_ORIENTATION=